MTSAQGGGEGGTQKEDENGQGGRGVRPIWMSYFWMILTQLCHYTTTQKKIIFDRMDSLLTLISNHRAVFCIEKHLLA